MTQAFNSPDPEVFRKTTSQIAQEIANLGLLILFGSRAKGTAREDSDWDLAILSQMELDAPPEAWGELSLYEKLGRILQIPSDRIDLVNLRHCSPLLGYVVAKEGKILYEAEPNLFRSFQCKAWHTYLDTAKLRSYQEEYIRRGLEKLKQ